MRSTRLDAALLIAALSSLPAVTVDAAKLKTEPVQTAPVAANPGIGRQLYERDCAQCHGVEGKGNGPAADFVYPRPRDFTLALFKVRSTRSGQLPTDHDLFRAISKGLPGTSMPAWDKYLKEEERWQLVHYVKTFDSLGLFKEEPAREQVVVSSAPRVTDELVARGKQVYQDKKCWQCHGSLGRGDGPSAEGMKDDWGFPIRPVNFTKSWVFRGGATLEDIYRTFTTGFNGTPMPSFADTINEDDRWALAAYVKSLTRPLRSGQVVRALLHAGGLPKDPYDKAWEAAEPLDVLLAGQIILEPRWFQPAHDLVTVRALYSEGEVAVMLTWDDGTHNKGAGGKPAEAATGASLHRGPRLDPVADQVAIQLPLERGELGAEKPYFLLGDRAHPVDYWRWSAARGLARQVFSGYDKPAARDAAGLVAQGDYRDGQYRVIFRRALAARTPRELAFTPGDYVPVAFHLWDGAQGEDGLKTAVSGWHYLLLEPAPPMTTYLWPAGVGTIVLAGELWLLRRSRRRAIPGARPSARSDRRNRGRRRVTCGPRGKRTS